MYAVNKQQTKSRQKMSAESVRANVIARLKEKFLVKDELSGISCGIENKNDAASKETAVEKHTVKSEIQMSPHTVNEKPVIDETKCDTYNIVNVENLTNNLAEKVNIKVDTDAKCDIKSDGTDKQQDVMEVTEKKVVNKVGLNQGLNKSAVILKKETTSLRNLLEYDSSSSDDDEAETEVEPNWQFRTINESESDSDDSLTSDTNDEEDDDEDDIGCLIKEHKEKRPKADSPFTEDFILKIYSENNLQDLPPIRDVSNLDIDVEREEFLHMGHIESVIETLITIETIPGTPAYDVDTCLFVEDTTLKRPLGAIYDVIGPVASPLYCIRYQNYKDIAGLNLKKGMKVFSAPKSQYTKYVFVKELMKYKGTDASWVGDIEIPPEIAAEMSDDDQEPDDARKAPKRKHTSQERHRHFEEDMNRSNALNSRAARLVDAQQGPRISRYGDHVQRALFGESRGGPVALFDPRVPPPGFSPVTGGNRESVLDQWIRSVAVTPMRLPRFQPGPAFMSDGQSRGSFFDGNAGGDAGHGAGTSSHPY